MTERSTNRNKLKGFDYILLLVTLGLIGIGLVLIYSSDHAQGSLSHFNKQLYFALFGLILMGSVAAIPGRVYYALTYVIYGMSVASLLLVMVLGIVGLGAKRWLALGGIQIQPSEFAKLAFILVLARLLSRRHSQYYGWKLVGIVVVVGSLLMGPILLQPDLGTSTVFGVIGISLLAWYGLSMTVFIQMLIPFLSLFVWVSPWFVIPMILGGFGWLWGAGMRWIGVVVLSILCIGATIAAPVAWNQLKPYQQKRLTIFLDPAADPLGAGYQVIQSQVAIGSGGITGQGYLKGTQTQLRFLPEQHTDFIFALMGEEFGFFGASTVILLIGIYCWRSFWIAQRAKNEFMQYVAVGMGTLVLYHSIVNIGMATGYLPVTGLPLPFLSYGRSFLMTCMIGTGLTLSAGLYRKD